jgi:hypothetical protein
MTRNRAREQQRLSLAWIDDSLQHDDVMMVPQPVGVVGPDECSHQRRKCGKRQERYEHGAQQPTASHHQVSAQTLVGHRNLAPGSEV